MMGHLNSFSASGGGNLNKHFPTIQMPRGLPREGEGMMLKLRFDWYIRAVIGLFRFPLPDIHTHNTLVTCSCRGKLYELQVSSYIKGPSNNYSAVVDVMGYSHCTFRTVMLCTCSNGWGRANSN